MSRPPARKSLFAGSSPAAPTTAAPEPVAETKPVAKPAARARKNSGGVATDPAPTTPAPKTTSKPRTTPAPETPADDTTSAEGTARLGIYLRPAQFNDAKGAYLADWTNGGEADTFARWIARAIDTHAARTPQERAIHGQPNARSATRSGASRSFTVPSTTRDNMRAAITADQKAGRWLSDSAWCGEAIDEAITVSRDANGGALPLPPARLPNRLTR